MCGLKINVARYRVRHTTGQINNPPLGLPRSGEKNGFSFNFCGDMASSDWHASKAFASGTANLLSRAMRLLENEVTINAPWGKLAGLTWGDPSNPPVVLCHGIMDVCSSFRPLVSLLPTSLFYVSVDLPGNGKSDQFPRGSRFTVVDFVPTILRIQQHFKWEKFAYIGHSLGVIIGKYIDIVYPGSITRVVELDPVLANDVWEANEFSTWYHLFYGDYHADDKYYGKNKDACADSAPRYTREKAMHLTMNNRGLTEEAAKHVLERLLEPAGDGLYRFNYAQRVKDIPRLPFGLRQLQELYTAVDTPTLAFLSKSLIECGSYNLAPFGKNPELWPNRNYSVKTVDGGHDFHINNPERISEDISMFLLEDFHKAKL